MKLHSLFKTPAFKPKLAIDRDDAAAIAIKTAIVEGDQLARFISNTVLEWGHRVDTEYSLWLWLPLTHIINGGNDETPGSLLRAACVGIAAGLGMGAMYGCAVKNSQDDVMDFLLATGLAEWEVGKQNRGHPPSPWNPEMTTHLRYRPGTLRGGKTSIAQQMMQFCLRGRNEQDIAETLLCLLGLIPDAAHYPAALELESIMMPRIPVAQDIIAAIANRIEQIDRFWPQFLKTRELVW